MASLKTLGFVLAIVTWGMVIIFIGLFLYRVYKAFIKKSDRKPLRQIPGNWYPKVLKVLFGFSVLLIMLSIPFYVYISSPYRSIIPSYLSTFLVVATLLLAGLEFLLTFTVSKKLIDETFKKVFLTIFVALLFPISIYTVVGVPTIFQYPDESNCYKVDLPVKGVWSAGHAGGSEKVNYHGAVRSQMYAMDIVKVNDHGQFYKEGGTEADDFYTMNEPIYSPVDGTIVNVVDSLPNIGITFTPSNKMNPAGNHVVIEFEPNRFVFLAHLNQGSIKVKKGEQVKSGDLVARAGNSGNTSWPHLHMHIQDKPAIGAKDTTGFPYRFKKIERRRWLVWSTVVNGFLVRNDLFRNPE